MTKVQDLFVGWYDYPKDVYDNIIDNGIISFDTNILLDLYRYSEEGSKNILSMFDTVKDRLIFSYYVAFEFTKNRKKVEVDSLNEYSKFKDKIEKKYTELIDEFSNISENKISKKTLISNIEKSKDKVLSSIQDEYDKKEKIFKEGFEKSICDLLNDRILDKFSDEEYESAKVEGIRRFKEQIPPGYKDSEKSENGDYYIFKQLIDYSKKEQKDIIFVTGDTKEDMFNNFNGIKTPRPELLQEFYAETNHRIIILSLPTFLNNKTIFNVKVSAKTINEINSIYFLDNYFSSKTNTRIRKFMYNAFKYDSIDKIEKNNVGIELSLRTLVNIYSSSIDDINLNKYTKLLDLINSKNYKDYYEQSAIFRERISLIRKNDYDHLIISYNNTKENPIMENIIYSISLLANYIECFADESEKNKLYYIKDFKRFLVHNSIPRKEAIKEFELVFSGFFDNEKNIVD